MAGLQMDSTVRRKPDMVATDMAGVTVMLDLDSGKYFALSGVGPHVWSTVEERRSVAEVVESVRGHFDVPEGEDVAGEVLAFLSSLGEKGLVEVGN